MAQRFDDAEIGKSELLPISSLERARSQSNGDVARRVPRATGLNGD
jgi:hypothetical protein